MRNLFYLVLCGMWTCLAVPAASTAQSEERYWTLYRDGAVQSSANPVIWPEPGKGVSPGVKTWGTSGAASGPTPGKGPGVGMGNPGAGVGVVRVMRDYALTVTLTGPRLLMVNGDVLPGRVVEITPADAASNKPGFLRVQLRNTFSGPQHQAPLLSVRLDYVQRLVLAEEMLGDYQPGTVILTDGRKINARGLRWTKDGLRVLTAEQILTLTLKELAEVHAPAADTITAVLRDGVFPDVKPTSLIGRLTTLDGAELTYAQDQMRQTQQIQQPGNRRVHSQIVQPIWALEPLTIPLDNIVVRSWRQPTEVPLSLLPAQTLTQKSYTGYAWQWQRNRAVTGGLLQCRRMSSDLGLGMHSFMQVAFDLPPGAQEFESYVGLAKEVGAGGCVALRIYADQPAGTPLWQSGFLQGSEVPLKVGPVVLPAQAKKLVLEVDYGEVGRPVGADPLDIRDNVNWLLPMVRVDPAALPKP